MLHLIRRRVHTAGLPPGELVHPTETTPAPLRLQVVAYDRDQLVEQEVAAPADCATFLERYAVTWINVENLEDTAGLEALGEQFGLHPLLLEDIVHTTQRPKVDDYENALFLVLKSLDFTADICRIAEEQICLVLGRNFVLSFQEHPGDYFDPIRERLRTSKGRLRAAGADFLAYSLLDGVVDNYFVVLEALGEQIDGLQDEVIERPAQDSLAAVHCLRREMLMLRRALWPLRAAVTYLEREESPFIGRELRPYLRDVYDHVTEAIEYTETFRDLLSGMLDIYLSSVSNRLNEVMKVLTIFATLFAPLTFLVGVYGMNFRHMPELGLTWTYPALWGLMLATAFALLWFFRKKRWL